MKGGIKKNSGIPAQNHGIDWAAVGSRGEPLYSDHAPIVLDNILSWNIMTQCRVGRFANNGFNFTETPEQYKARLQRIAVAIGNIVKAEKLTILALQEAPVEQPYAAFFFNELQKSLGNDYVISAEFLQATPGTSSGTLTCYNKNKLMGKNVTSRYEAVKTFGPQSGRIQVTEFKNKTNHLSFKFANGHFDFTADHTQAVDNIMKEGMMLAADFNRDVYHIKHDAIIRSALNGESFSYDAAKQRQSERKRYDAILISKYLIPSEMLKAAQAQEAKQQNTAVASQDDVAYESEPTFATTPSPTYLASPSYLSPMPPAALSPYFAQQPLPPTSQTPFYASPAGLPYPTAPLAPAPFTPYYGGAYQSTTFQAPVVPVNPFYERIRDLAPGLERYYAYYKPPQGEMMGELHFTDFNAAQAFLQILKNQGVIKNSHKMVYTTPYQQTSFNIPLGEGEIERLFAKNRYKP